MTKPLEFPGWEEYYKENKNETMPWYHPYLDSDLEEELKSRNITSGKFLDAGTGLGTQAKKLSEMGFDVMGTDLSASAIEKAKKASPLMNFVVDDILDSKLESGRFDFVFDRGLFHTIDEKDREKYVNTLIRLLKQGGILFLKCFSIDEPGTYGPNRISKDDLIRTFSESFTIELIKDTVFQVTTEKSPRALFAVMKKN